jgi:hypothetical protein
LRSKLDLNPPPWLPPVRRGWLRDRSADEFDVEDIGALAVPVPAPSELSDAVRVHYQFLAELDPDEQVIARARERDRPLALRMLAKLPGRRLEGVGLY